MGLGIDLLSDEFVTWAKIFFFYCVLVCVDRLRGGEAGFRTAS